MPVPAIESFPCSDVVLLLITASMIELAGTRATLLLINRLRGSVLPSRSEFAVD